jgi:hypothetical protein
VKSPLEPATRRKHSIDDLIDSALRQCDPKNAHTGRELPQAISVVLRQRCGIECHDIETVSARCRVRGQLLPAKRANGAAGREMVANQEQPA